MNMAKKQYTVRIQWKNDARSVGQVSVSSAGVIGWISRVPRGTSHPEGGWCAHFSYWHAVHGQANVYDFEECIHRLVVEWIMCYRVEITVKEGT